LLDIIVVSLAIILLFFCYHPPNFELLHEHKSKKQQMKELDYPGMFLWTAGLVIFLLGISWVGLVHLVETFRTDDVREEASTRGSRQQSYARSLLALFASLLLASGRLTEIPSIP
jgi:hypothetical protein